MSKNLPKAEKLISISEAAEFLGVSLDTIRRWDKLGTLHSQRPNGKDRFFSLGELEAIKTKKPLSISQASSLLKVSPTTLRRLDKKGLINPEKNSAGERVYTREIIDTFLKSEYFLRKQDLTGQVLRSFEEKPKDNSPKIVGESPMQTLTKPTEKLVLSEHEQKIGILERYRKIAITSFIFLIISTGVIIAIITLSWLLYPDQTAQFFGFTQKDLENSSQAQILGASTTSQEVQETSLIAKILRPHSAASLVLAQIRDSQLEKYYLPADIDSLLYVDQSNKIVFKKPLLLSSDLIKITNENLIENLNADLIDGHDSGTLANQVLVINQDGDIAIGGGAQFGGNVSANSLDANSISTTNATFQKLNVTDFTPPDSSVTSLSIK